MTSPRLDKPAPAFVADEKTARTAATAALVGTAMEWYDFFLFTTASALVFNVQFFDKGDPFLASLSSFATMAVGFVARPIGGLIFGHLGDRVGRKTVLMITIVGIGITTGLIGVLPNYATIGVAAPVLLVVLRICQGLAVGGEWGGAVTAAVESAPAEKRARYAAYPQIGSPIGTLLSSGGFFLVGLLITQPGAFDSWGWRIPFLLALPLLLVAVYVRSKLEETPVFQEIEAEHEKAAAPIVQVLKHSWLQVIVGFGTNFVGLGGFFLVTTFVVSYGKNTLGLSNSLMLGATLVAAACEILIIVFFGRLGERWGAAKVSTFGGIATVLVAFPIFLMVDTKQPLLVILGMTIGVCCLSIPYAVNGALLTALFPAHYRLSGVSLCANISAIFAGFIPMLATAFQHMAGDAWWPAPIMLVVIAGITAVCSVLAPRLSIDVPGYRH
ncbi:MULTISPECIES: MFS transporter [Brevibacterium]|uniref:MFS transporter n=1 Tax=Brevibacterium TaxID=1696 RepID=UPI00227F8A9C|nr:MULTISPECIES: MFS transporter [Brevibacterium]WAL39927.1 MFS transporter [Brevibacterium sp. BRM-1]